MTELNSELFQTGKNFNTQIHDNKGSFEFKNTQLESPFVELKADGYYYNEVKGEKNNCPYNTLCYIRCDRCCHIKCQYINTFGKIKS